MARRKKASTRKPAAERATQAPEQRKDIRPYIYVGLDQLFVVIYVYVLVAVIPNRLASATVHLWALPVLLQLTGIGTGTIWLRAPELRKVGWWLAVASGAGLVAMTVLLIVRVLISAAFLAGVYGAFGKAAAVSALIGVALVVELVALLPLFQIKYLRTRAGRHAYGMQ